LYRPDPPLRRELELEVELRELLELVDIAGKTGRGDWRGWLWDSALWVC